MNSAYEYKNFDELISLLNQNERKYDLKLIERAFEKAKLYHGEQKRVSGVPYILHPVSVAYILAELGMDSQSIVAALLHDVVEDTSANAEEIKSEFGEEIAKLVDGVTKFKIIDSSEEEQRIRSIRKMLIAMSQDIRVIIIKLADRLNNMRTIGCMPDYKRRKKSLENMELFVPIAHRLGIKSIKEELEDLSLKYIDPKAYDEIEKSLKLTEDDRKKLLNNTKTKIMEKIAPLFPGVHIEGRVKSINGIYSKVVLKGRTMDEIYDVYAIRVIVNTINDCYNVLGIIHEMFNPIPNRFKDYISIPKPNMYQSLHTTVLGQDGIPFEFQIRTWDMHKIAEYGIAAHWKYKLNSFDNKSAIEKCLSWIKSVVDYQNDNEDLSDVMSNIKLDLGPEEVFALTTKGKPISLPAGATVIDFAYAISTETGHRMIGAKVDKRIVPINYTLKTGEIVEIIATEETGRGPGREWLKIVKTSAARNKIQQWFKKEKRSDNIIEGKIALERELKKAGIFLSDEAIAELFVPLLKHKKYHSINDLYAVIGYGGMELDKIISFAKKQYIKLLKTYDENKFKAKEKSDNSCKHTIFSPEVPEAGLFKLCSCCHPIPYDDIIGFLKKNGEVSVHRANCQYVLNDIELDNAEKKWIKVIWSGDFTDKFSVSLEIMCSSKSKVLPDITMQFYYLNIKLMALSFRNMDNEKIIIEATILINSSEQLNAVTNVLSQVSGVTSIKRI